LARDRHSHSIHIEATPAEVFEYFIRPEMIVRWMGDHAVLDARPGGEFTLDINGVPVRGRYIELEPPHRLLLSWGHAGSAQLPPGASTVEVRFTPTARGTTVIVTHWGLPDAERAGHAIGWAHFLERLRTLAVGADPGPDPWAI
jgi:uncharacterized protein YndB with AHSA1/START domain